MRMIGCKGADAASYPGLITQECEKDEGFSHDLSAAIEGWVDKTEQAGLEFEKGEG